MEFSGRLHLPQCQSTNDEMQALLTGNKGALPEGFLLSTDFQSAGRGQRGNTWEAAPGENLLFSILLRPAFLEPGYAFRLTATLASGIALALEKICPGLTLKWPNDLYVQNRKLGGMLIETSISGQSLDRAICGIGININQQELPSSAVSLIQLSGQAYDREALLQQLYAGIMQQYRRLASGDWPGIRTAYLSRLYRLAQTGWYRTAEGERFSAILKGVSEEGELILICREGEKRFRFKEIAFENE